MHCLYNADVLTTTRDSSVSVDEYVSLAQENDNSQANASFGRDPNYSRFHKVFTGNIRISTSTINLLEYFFNYWPILTTTIVSKWTMTITYCFRNYGNNPKLSIDNNCKIGNKRVTLSSSSDKIASLSLYLGRVCYKLLGLHYTQNDYLSRQTSYPNVS
jgi:hypothetical protein